MEIRCRECGKEIKEDFRVCPYCGKEVSIQSDKTVYPKLKEKMRPIYGVITFIISCIIFIILASELKYANNATRSFSIIELYSKLGKIYLNMVVSFGIIIFISFILSIISDKLAKISKITYALSLVNLIIINCYAVSKGYRITLLYLVIYVLVAAMLLMNRKTKLVEEEIVVKPDEIDKLKNENEKLKEQVINRKNNKILFIVIAAIVTLIGISSTIVFTNKGFIKKQTKANTITNVESNEGKKKIVIIQNDYINVRSGTSTKSDKIGKVLKDEKYEVLETINSYNYTWYKIKDSNNQEGYIANPKGNNKYVIEEYIDPIKDSIELSLISVEEKKEEETKEETNNNSNSNKNNNNYTPSKNNTTVTTPQPTSKPTQVQTPTPTPVETPKQDSTPTTPTKKTMDAIKKYKCQGSRYQLNGDKCTFEWEADRIYICPAGYKNYAHDECISTLDSIKAATCTCYRGRLLGNRCVDSSYQEVGSPSCRCDDYRYTYNGRNCELSDYYRYYTSYDYYYTCNIVTKERTNSSTCTNTEDAILDGYTCPDGYTLDNDKCIEN